MVLYDIKDTVVTAAKEDIFQNMTLFCQAGLLREEDITSAMVRLSQATHLQEAVAIADFVVEAVSEDLSVKQQIFNKTESFCGTHTIIASNTSSLTIRRNRETREEQTTNCHHTLD